MSRQNLKVRSGNRVKVVFNGVAVGLLQDVRFSDDYGTEPASGIGDARAAEYVPGMARHQITASQMVLFSGAMRQAGIAAENSEDMLRGMVFDVTVTSNDDGSVLRKYIDCSYASGDITIQKHGIMVSNGSFNALDVAGKSM